MSPTDPSIKSIRPKWAGAKAPCPNPVCGRKWTLDKEDMHLPGFVFIYQTGDIIIPCQDCGALITVKKADYKKQR